MAGARFIAMAKDSLFATEKQSAKASVVLKLKGRKPLAPQTITAIAGLVASSVEDLRPESVVVLDTFGRSLTGKENQDDEDGSGLNLDKQHRLERDLTTKVVALLEPIVGEGHARECRARLNANPLRKPKNTGIRKPCFAAGRPRLISGRRRQAPFLQEAQASAAASVLVLVRIHRRGRRARRVMVQRHRCPHPAHRQAARSNRPTMKWAA